MKTYVYKLSIALAAILLVSCKATNSLSTEERKAQIENNISSMNYTFVPRTALPMGGQSINLTYSFSLKVSKDTIDAYLPYFGRAYTAPIDPSQGGIKFVSTDFEYKISEKKKGMWNVDIVTKDTREKTVMNLSISETGGATLSVNDNNRQSITFYGELK